MSAVWNLSQGDTGPVLTGTLERETSEDVFVPENLTGVLGVTLTLYRANNSVYKSAAVTIVDAPKGRVSYAWVAADSAQGTLTGKCRVTYANGVVVSFPNTGQFQIRVSR